MSLFLLLGVGTTPIGGILVGVLSARFGVQPTIVLMGVACLVGVIAASAYAWWSASTRGQPVVITPTSMVDEREELASRS